VLSNAFITVNDLLNSKIEHLCVRVLNLGLKKMNNESESYEYKLIPDVLVASVRKPIKKRGELKEYYQFLRETCGDVICGDAIMLLHYDTMVKDGLDVEVAYPISNTVEIEGIECKILKSVYAFTTTHVGSYEGLGPVTTELHKFRSSRGLPSGLSPREVYLTGPFMENPEDNITEIQVTVHDWESRFHNGIKQVLGSERYGAITSELQDMSEFTSSSERGKKLTSVFKKLDYEATEAQKYEIISGCAHIRPLEEVSHWKHIYEQTNDIDEMLRFYAESQQFIEKPYRVGNIIYTSKPPADPEAYANAETQEDKIRAACFCPLIHSTLDEMPRSYCYCGAGWARQLFEPIIGVPLEIDIVETVIDGGDICKFAVHLPDGFFDEV